MTYRPAHTRIRLLIRHYTQTTDLKIRAMRVHSKSSPDCLAGVTNPLFWFLGRILVRRPSQTRPSQVSGSVRIKACCGCSRLLCAVQGGSVYVVSAISNSLTLLKVVTAQTGLQNPIKNTDDKQRSIRCPAFRPSHVLCEDLPPVRILSRLNQKDLLLQY